MPKPRIVIHNGALGDFCTAWPALLALARDAGNAPCLWAGRAVHTAWAVGAGMQPASPELRRATDRLYAAESWPTDLGDAEIWWLGLEADPPFALRSPRIRYLPSLDREGYTPPTDMLRTELATHGVPWPEDWRETWDHRFGRWDESVLEPDAPVLLFPGAGHPVKQWPLVQFFELMDELSEWNHTAAWVLGPAELERGMRKALRRAGRFEPVFLPDDLAGLSALLLAARAVVGNDCGPLHLAGLHGVPGVALFGPTPARQWGPRGMTIVRPAVDCRPCTRTTRRLDCDDPHCMAAIGVGEVLHALKNLQ